MKNLLFSALVLSVITIQSCATKQTDNNYEETFWISGFKTEASTGVGKRMVYVINKETDYTKGNWEMFYNSIQDFNFEEGTMKQITVSQKHLDKSQVPADASSIQYTLKEEIKSILDNRLLLQGNWIVARLNEQPLNRKVVVPTLSLQLDNMQFSGNDGCNSYMTNISKLTTTEIQIGNIASTRKACIKDNVSDAYYKALTNIHSYQVDTQKLQFLDKDGNSLVEYIKN